MKGGQQFQLGTRRVFAEGTICDHHPNVMHLRVLPKLPRLAPPPATASSAHAAA